MVAPFFRATASAKSGGAETICKSVRDRHLGIPLLGSWRYWNPVEVLIGGGSGFKANLSLQELPLPQRKV